MFGELFLPLLGKVVEGLLVFTGLITAIPQFLKDNERAIKLMVAGLILFNYQMVISNGQYLLKQANIVKTLVLDKADLAMQKLKVVWLFRQNLTWKALNATMAANPIGFVIKVISLLVIGFGLLYNKSIAVRSVVNGLWSVVKELGLVVKETFMNFVDAFKLLLTGDIIGGMAAMSKAIIKANPVVIAATQGKRLAKAYTDGFNEEADAAKKAEILKKLNEAILKELDEKGITGIKKKVVEEDPVKDLRTALERLGDELKAAEKALERLAGKSNTPEFKAAANKVAELRKRYKEWTDQIADAVEAVYAIEEANKYFAEQGIENVDPGFKALPRPEAPGVDGLVEDAQKRAEALDKISEELESKREKEIRDVQEHYMELISLAIRYAASEEDVERLRQAKKKALDDIDASDAEKKKKKREEGIKGLTDESVNFVQTTLSTFSQIAQTQAETLNKAYSEQAERVDKYKELAERGNSEQLQIEEDRLARIEKAREKAVERQRILAQAQMLINQALAASETIKFIAQSFGEGGGLLGIATGTLAALSLALTIGGAVGQLTGLFGGLPSFAEGTERVRGPGTRTSDSILARVSRDERIVPGAINDQLHGIPNKNLPAAVMAYMSMPLIFGTLRKIEGQGADIKGLRDDMGRLIHATETNKTFLEVSERGIYAGYHRGYRITDREKALA
jgi:hypothetical protein